MYKPLKIGIIGDDDVNRRSQVRAGESLVHSFIKGAAKLKFGA